MIIYRDAPSSYCWQIGFFRDYFVVALYKGVQWVWVTLLISREHQYVIDLFILLLKYIVPLEFKILGYL
jgi:hypothetical protein